MGKDLEKSRELKYLLKIQQIFINKQNIVDLFSAFFTSRENTKSKRGEESLHVEYKSSNCSLVESSFAFFCPTVKVKEMVMFAFYLKPIHYFKSLEFSSYLLQCPIFYQKQLHGSLCLAVLLFNNGTLQYLALSEKTLPIGNSPACTPMVNGFLCVRDVLL